MHDLTQYAISLLIFFILVNYFVVKKFLINTKRIKNRADYERVVEELRERKEHYEKIINTINECIITINDKDIIIDCNKASKLIFNYEPEELLGKSIDFIVKDKLIPNVIITAECKTKDGKGIFVDISCAEAKEPKEKVIFAVTRNMTNQRNMFQEIKILNETLSVRVDALKGFQYTISHDLNGPLRHIEGYSQILEEDYAPQLNKEGIEVIKKIRSSAKFLVQLVKDIMRLSEISDGKIKVNKIDFNLSFMIKSIIDDLIKTNEKEVLVKVANDVVCHGDKNLVEIAVTNLLHNAVNFSSKKNFRKSSSASFSEREK